MRSPIGWYGGKGQISQKILGLFPPHKIYVEVFGGAASLLFAKKPVGMEVYNDIDGRLVQFFRVLRDQFEEFHRLVALTPYSREEYYHCRDTYDDCIDEVERAYKFFVVAKQSFSGIWGQSWSFAVSDRARSHISDAVAKWLSVIERLPGVRRRLMRVQIEHRDFRFMIQTYNAPGTLLYLDPPYVLETRQGAVYENEMMEDDHKDLVNLLLEYSAMAVLSGYNHPIYAPLEDAGWERTDFEVDCKAAAKTRATELLGQGSGPKRVESVWLNPAAIEAKEVQRRLF